MLPDLQEQIKDDSESLVVEKCIAAPGASRGTACFTGVESDPAHTIRSFAGPDVRQWVALHPQRDVQRIWEHSATITTRQIAPIANAPSSIPQDTRNRKEQTARVITTNEYCDAFRFSADCNCADTMRFSADADKESAKKLSAGKWNKEPSVFPGDLQQSQVRNIRDTQKEFRDTNASDNIQKHILSLFGLPPIFAALY